MTSETVPEEDTTAPMWLEAPDSLNIEADSEFVVGDYLSYIDDLDSTVDMTVEDKNKDYAAAAGRTNEKLSALRAVCEKLGHGDGLKTASYNVRTEYTGVNEDGIYKNVFDGYVCSCGLSLSFDFDAGRLASLMDGLASCGADARLNVSFSVKDPAAAEASLLEAVCDDAKKKADVICRRLEACPGKLLSVRQGGGIMNMRS